MNKNQYRLLYNPARNQLMVVPEHASSKGGTSINAIGNTTSSANLAAQSIAFSVASHYLAQLKRLSFAALRLLALPAVVVMSAASLATLSALSTLPAQAAGLAVDTSAPANQRPLITNAANGVPVVNIQTPSAAGVSHNTYSQFDVTSQGVILNNSSTNVSTQLGGYIQGNPYLPGSTARVILNEVNSSNPSLLHGYIEVAGSRAQVIVANPSGISCDGCGFINTSRATLTTGIPLMSGGDLIGYRVTGGVINFLGAGLDTANTNYTDVIARATTLNAGLFAQHLNVITGSNQVNVASAQNGNATVSDAYISSITPIAGTGSAPAFVIDVSALGGMYAGKIHLIGTESGLGMRNAGSISATSNINPVGAAAGEVRIDVNGQILNNNATIASTGLTDINATNISNTGGAITAGNTLNINATSVTGDGKLLSGGDASIALQSDYTQTSAGELQATHNIDFTTIGNLTNQSSILAGNALTLNAANISNQHTLSANGTVTLNAATIDNSAGSTISGLNTYINATNVGGTGTLTNRGLIDGSDTFINANTVNNIGTGSIFGDHIAIAANTLTNNTEIVNGTTTAATIAARNRLDIGANTITNREHALLFSAGDIAIGGGLDANHLATGQATTLNNNSATIEATGNLSLNIANINNTNAHFTTQDVLINSQNFDEMQGQGGLTRYTTPAGMAILPGLPSCGGDCFNTYNTPAPNSNAYATSVRDSMYQWVIGGTQYRNSYRFVYNSNTTETQVLSSDPAKMLSGGAMHINANNLLNDKSTLIAGSALTASIGTLTNTTVAGQHTVTDTGSTYVYITHDPSGGGNDYTEIQGTGYTPAPSVQAINLTPTTYQQNTSTAGATSGTTVANLSTVTLPNNSLFSSNPNPTAGYLIETNPRFANYRTWLSSDYMLSQLNLDPTFSLKRLGDGFYEQKLIREQINQLTGRRFLVGFANEEAQYQALMNSGVTSAKAFNLQAGIALSKEQVAQLTSDIVWLVEQEVVLPAQYDSAGKLIQPATKTQALVPHVYVAVKAGDLNSNGQLLSGALISANSTQLTITGDLNNSNGTIAGRTLLALNANNINNLGGRLTATDVNVYANNDLNNIGGTIDAQHSLIATAGHDLNVISSTSTQSNATGSRTNISRVAGLYVTGDASLPLAGLANTGLTNTGLPSTGTLIASAGNNLKLDGAQIVNSSANNAAGNNTVNTNQTTLQAGHDVSLGTVKTAEQNNITWNSKNTLNQANSTELGSNIKTNGDITINAGRDAKLTAASIKSGDSRPHPSPLPAGEGATNGGNLTINAANNINISTGQTTANSVGNTSYGYGTTASTASALKQEASSLSAGNNLSLQSGSDTHITSANLSAGKNLDVAATGNLTIDAAKDNSQLDYAYNAKNKRDIIRNLDENVVASNLNAGDHINLTATHASKPVQASALQTNAAATNAVPSSNSGNLSLNSVNLNSQTGAVVLNADQDVTIGTTAETHDHFAEHYTKTKSLLSSRSTRTIDQSQDILAIGSSVSGNMVTVNAGQDLNVQGSSVVATQETKLNAQNNITIIAAQEMHNESHFKETKKSGFSTSGASISLGKSKLTTTNDTQSVTNTASTVGSVQGNTNVHAGLGSNAAGNQTGIYTQTGSDVLAPQGDVNITASQVNITAAQNTSNSQQTTQYKQSGITVSVSNPVISAAQTVQQMASAASHTKDGRMQLLAAGTAALAVSNAKDALLAGQADQYGNVATAGSTGKDDLTHVREANAADAVGGISLSVSIGSSKSSSSSTQTSSTAQSSHVTAGKDVNITATGAGKASDLNVIGSQIKAANNVTLKADNAINLQAAQNTATLNSSNKSSSSSLGVSVSSTGGVTGNLAMSQGRGSANGQDITYTETSVQSGNKVGDKVSLNSGADTNIIGSQVIGYQVMIKTGVNPTTGEVGTGNLNIQSLQDSSTYTDKQSSAGFSVSVPIYGAGSVGGSINASKSSTKSNYLSVSEQAGIFAGNGGFQVNVAGNTDLKGAVIASSEKAIKQNLNSLTTQTLTTSNIDNSADYKASGYSISAGLSIGQTQNNQPIAGVTKSIGWGSSSDDANSVTVSGISGATVSVTDNTQQQTLTNQDTATTIARLNRDVHTVIKAGTDAQGNTTASYSAVDSQGNNLANTITPIFDKEKVQRELDAQIQITQSFDQAQQQFRMEINRKVDTAKAEKDAIADKLKNPDLSEQQRGDLITQGLNAQKEIEQLENMGLVFSAVAGGLSAPTNSIGGIMANSLAPEAANQIGQYFKDHGTEGSAPHILAHGVLAGAVAALGGNNPMGAALSAMGGEMVAPLVADLLYGKPSEELNAEQKSTVSAIASLGGIAVGAGMGGNVNDIAQANLAAQNAVDNNWGAVGHYSTMATVLYLAGFSVKDAKAVALAAWGPDTDKRNAMNPSNVSGANAPNSDQQAIHLLDSENDPSKVVAKQQTLAEQVRIILLTIKQYENDPTKKAAYLTTPSVQNTLHAFGDAFAHVEKDGTHYPAGEGHLSDRAKPDDPNTHANAYKQYVNTLFSVAAQVMVIPRVNNGAITNLVNQVTAAASEDKQIKALDNAIGSIPSSTSSSLVNSPVGECGFYGLGCQNKPIGSQVNPQINSVYGVKK